MLGGILSFLVATQVPNTIKKITNKRVLTLNAAIPLKLRTQAIEKCIIFCLIGYTVTRNIQARILSALIKNSKFIVINVQYLYGRYFTYFRQFK
jgi:hypothetical protein